MAKYSEKFIEMLKGAAEHGHEIYDLNATTVIADLAGEVAEDLGITKTDAKIMVLNALLYNLVQEEVKSQCRYLLGIE